MDWIESNLFQSISYKAVPPARKMNEFPEAHAGITIISTWFVSFIHTLTFLPRLAL